jgi:hypothetical protein
LFLGFSNILVVLKASFGAKVDFLDTEGFVVLLEEAKLGEES